MVPFLLTVLMLVLSSDKKILLYVLLWCDDCRTDIGYQKGKSWSYLAFEEGYTPGSDTGYLDIKVGS